MLVSGGYPGDFEKGKVISGIDSCHGSLVFHAGTSDKNESIITSGGRVIAITSLGNNLTEALETSMRNASLINYEGKYFRKHIGKDLM